MHWILQNNLFSERGWDTLMESLERLQIPHSIVKVIPFRGGLEPDPVVEGPAVVFGSYSLVWQAQARGWTPGAWLNENFDYTRWSVGFGPENCLNGDSQVLPFGQTPDLEEFFIRPCDDSKAFAGMVLTREQHASWAFDVAVIANSGSEPTLTPDTPVMVCRPKAIQREWRFFVVDGEVVTGSLYRMGGRVIYRAEIDPDARAFAQAMVARWTPDRAFVLDVAQTDTGYSVVEINNLNSAGFYASDTRRLVEAIESMGY